MANRSYDQTTKSSVMAALLEGQSVSAVAKEYDIPKGTVSNWKRSTLPGVQANRTQKDNDDVGELLMVLLRTNIESLIAISRTTQEPDWIKKQDAAELATFFGVKHDKVVRLIDALNGSNAEGS